MADSPGLESMRITVRAISDAKGSPGASERERVALMLARASASAVKADPVTLTHCYIALKSKPLAVLVGPAGRGKVALVESISQALLGHDPIDFQKMNGHAWWAGGSGNVAFFTQAQTRFNTTKLLALIHEALQPENRNRVYLACMTRISPAELQGYFAALAFQLQHGELIRLPTAHFNAPIPYPPNLLVVGTMDAVRFDWFDSRLLERTSLIFWPTEAEARPGDTPEPLPSPSAAGAFPPARVRNTTVARLKLGRHFRWPSQIIWPFSELISALERIGVVLPDNVLGEAVIYLANCWADDDPGLYDPTPERNLEIALDMAVLHAVLPHCLRAINQAQVQARPVSDLLRERFPRTQAALSQWTNSA